LKSLFSAQKQTPRTSRGVWSRAYQCVFTQSASGPFVVSRHDNPFMTEMFQMLAERAKLAAGPQNN
ncbi:hypothetical protein, partial [Pseudomonas guariconensis]|uniref:hypothetical protein n=1 Tax=Pseudomonas guariconensis TaxID=1288410 RepID=UPI001E503544